MAIQAIIVKTPTFKPPPLASFTFISPSRDFFDQILSRKTATNLCHDRL
jgi:hypothetical protein